MTRLHDALDGIAEKAPEVHVPPGFYRRARLRSRLRSAAAALSVLAVVGAGALIAPFVLKDGQRDRVGAAGSAGLPDDLAMPPWWTRTVPGSPAGPASVMFSASDGIPQADHEDYDLAWWRSDYTVYPSVAVGLHSDRYRIVRGPYGVGTELSPDGRYLLTQGRRVLDLETGTFRAIEQLRKEERFADAAWSADGTRILVVDDTVTRVLAWPSLTEQARFSHPEHRPGTQDLALSPDGSMLAVNSNEALTVYRAGAGRVWTFAENQADVGRLRLAGRAAWHPDGRLSTFGRTDLTCSDCGVHPGTWTLLLTPPLNDDTSPFAFARSSYPVVRNALDVKIIAWRGETAYAVVTYSDGSAYADPGTVELIRMRPGRAEYERLLTAPDGADSMMVATEFVDTFRATGDPEFGVNALEVVGQGVNGFLCISPVVLVIVGLVLLRRRSRPRRRARRQRRHR